MNKIIKELIAITLCFLIPFEALSIDIITKRTEDNLNNVSANQSESTPKKNQIKSPINFKIPACLLTAGASFATLYKLLGPIGGKNSLPQEEKRFTNAGIYNTRIICFCNALLQILYSNISFRKFIDEINLDDLSKCDFSYEFSISETHKGWPAVYLDELHGKSDGTISDYNKDASKKQALFKRKVELFRELFNLMDKEDVVPKSFMRDFVFVTLTDFPRDQQDVRDCFFDFLRDVVCLYCQHYNISSPKCITGVFPTSIFSCSVKIAAAQFFASNIFIYSDIYLKGSAIDFADKARRIVPLFGQFTIFHGSQGALLFPENVPSNSPGAGYEFKHTDGKTYVLTAVVNYNSKSDGQSGHYYTFKREADGNWYEYNDSLVSKTSWSNVKKAIENLNTNEYSGGLVYTFTEKEVFEQSMREAAQK